MREIQDYWDSSELDEILQMTESDVLQSIAAKYSNENITITILADQTAFECMDSYCPDVHISSEHYAPN